MKALSTSDKWHGLVVGSCLLIAVVIWLISSTGCDRIPSALQDQVCPECEVCPDWTIGGVVDDILGEPRRYGNKWATMPPNSQWWHSQRPRPVRPPTYVPGPVPGNNP